MSNLRTNTIVIRDTSYKVQEMSGKVMAEVRKLLDNDKGRLEIYVAFKCTVEPAFKTEADVMNEPHSVVSALSSEAFRLTKDEDEEAKNA